MTPEFKKEVKGQRKETKKSWAEVCFVPNAIGHSKKGPEYSYIAIGEAMEEQLSFAGMEDGKTYPFQTMKMEERGYASDPFCFRSKKGRDVTRYRPTALISS